MTSNYQLQQQENHNDNQDQKNHEDQKGNGGQLLAATTRRPQSWWATIGCSNEKTTMTTRLGSQDGKIRKVIVGNC